MITVTVKGVAEIGKMLSAGGEMTVELPDQAKLKDLLDYLAAETSTELVEHLTTEKSTKTLRLLVNGRDIVFLQNLDTELKDQDRVSILPLLSGG